MSLAASIPISAAYKMPPPTGLPSPPHSNKHESFLQSSPERMSALLSPPLSPLHIKKQMSTPTHLHLAGHNAPLRFTQNSVPSSPASVRSQRSANSLRSNSTSIFERDVELPCPTHTGARGAREAIDLSVPSVLAGAMEALALSGDPELEVETAVQPGSLPTSPQRSTSLPHAQLSQSPIHASHRPPNLKLGPQPRHSLSLNSLHMLPQLENVSEDSFLPLMDPDEPLFSPKSARSIRRQASSLEQGAVSPEKRRLSFVSYSDLIMERPTSSQSFHSSAIPLSPDALTLDKKQRPPSAYTLNALGNAELPHHATFLDNCLIEGMETVTERGAARTSASQKS